MLGDKIGLCATVKLFHLYLEDGSALPLDLLHMRISPWLWFRQQACRKNPPAAGAQANHDSRPGPEGPGGYREESMRNTSMAAASRLRNIIMVSTPHGSRIHTELHAGDVRNVRTVRHDGHHGRNAQREPRTENREAVTRLDLADRVVITGILLPQTAVGLWAFTAYLASAPTTFQQAIHWGRGANVVRSIRPTLIHTWPAGILTAWMTTFVHSRWPQHQEALGWALLAALILMGIGAVVLTLMSWTIMREFRRQFREWRSARASRRGQHTQGTA